jgi:hypothetical protein
LRHIADRVNYDIVRSRATKRDQERGSIKYRLAGLPLHACVGFSTFLINGGADGTGSCGGAWSGSFEESVTHVTFEVEVVGGMLDVDWVVGGPFGTSGFISGIQLDNLNVVSAYNPTWSEIKGLYR